MLAPIENRAATIGPDTFPWWRDWRGQAVAIIASGPSVRKSDIAQLQGKLPVMAIKKNVELAPWAEVVYGCDAPWWKSVLGLPKFSGLKLSYDEAVCRTFKLNRIRIPNPKSDEMSFTEPASVGSGGNSGFQAINIAAQFGANRILLIGFDMQDRSGAHWYGRNNWMGANNPTQDNFRRWLRAYANAARQLQHLGAEVVNASPVSALTCFPRGTVGDTLKRWGL